MSTENTDVSGSTGSSVSQYDCIMAAIPVPLLLGAGVRRIGQSAPTVALGLGAALSAAIVVYAVTAAAPVDTERTDAPESAASAEPDPDPDSTSGPRGGSSSGDD